MAYKTAHEANLGGVNLSSVDSSIIVLGCSAEAGKDTLSAQAVSGRGGQRITGATRDYIEATVKFGILCRRSNMNSRSAIFEKAISWAAAARDANAWLKFGQKPGRQLRVRLSSLPAEGDPWEWNKEYSITFRACEVPYWQDTSYTTVTQSSGTSLSQSITVPGSARTVAELTYVNNSSSTCDTLSISTGAATMNFTGLGILAGETFQIIHTADGVLRIRIKNSSDVYRSVFAKRTALTSDDDLWIMPGSRTVTGTAQRTGSWTISCRGRYE